MMIESVQERKDADEMVEEVKSTATSLSSSNSNVKQDGSIKDNVQRSEHTDNEAKDGKKKDENKIHDENVQVGSKVQEHNMRKKSDEQMTVSHNQIPMKSHDELVKVVINMRVSKFDAYNEQFKGAAKEGKESNDKKHCYKSGSSNLRM
jgi:hypothetical protein